MWSGRYKSCQNDHRITTSLKFIIELSSPHRSDGTNPFIKARWTDEEWGDNASRNYFLNSRVTIVSFICSWRCVLVKWSMGNWKYVFTSIKPLRKLIKEWCNLWALRTVSWLISIKNMPTNSSPLNSIWILRGVWLPSVVVSCEGGCIFVSLLLRLWLTFVPL